MHHKSILQNLFMQYNHIGVLFDLDGVILDTESVYTEFWDKIDHLFPTQVSGFSYIIKGSSLSEILDKYFAKENHEKIVALLNDFQINMKYRYFPFAIEWVKTLYNVGVDMCIVTSSDQQKMDAVYQQHPEFSGYFKAVVVGEMVKRAKPAPDCFLLGAKLLGKNIRNCYIFEDSLNGLKAAISSGGKTIALSTTNPPEKLSEARLIIPNFKDFTMEKMLGLK